MPNVLGYLVKRGEDELFFIYPTAFIEDGKVRGIEKAERFEKFKNRGTIFVPPYNNDYYSPYYESGLVRFYIDDSDISINYDASDLNSCEYFVGRKPEFFKSDEIIELIEFNRDIKEIINDSDRIITINYKPFNKKIFLQIDDYLYGPLEYISSKKDDLTYELKLRPEQIKDYRIYRYDMKKLQSIIHWSKTSYSTYEQRAFIYNIDDLEGIEPEEEIDFIEDNRLINILKTILVDQKEIKLTNDTIRKIKKTILNNNLIDDKLLTQNRIERLIKHEQLTETLLNYKNRIMEEYLESDNSKSFKENYVKENFNELRELDEFKVIEAELNNLQHQIEDKKQQIFQLEEDKRQREEKLEIKVIKEKKEDIKKLDDTIDQLTKELTNKEAQVKLIRERHNILDDYCKLKDKRIQLDDEIDKLAAMKNRREEDIRDLDNNITNKIEQITTTSKNLELFNRFYRKVNYSGNENETSQYCIPENIEKTIKAEDIIEKIHKDFSDINRELSKESIINYLITFTQNFITVFAGEPGTGKTSFTRLFAKSLGLYDERYLHIPINRGWTSQKDLIGYYNPLTKMIEKSETGLYEFLLKINEEHKNNRHDIPSIILLDEANLSPLEHYWSTFSSIYENTGDRTIKIGPNNNMNLTKSLKFLATINNDHTTEMLSPRFLDRTAVILMERIDDFSFEEGFSDESSLCNNDKIISYDLLEKYFNNLSIREKDLDSMLKSLLERIYETCNNPDTSNLTISYRTNNAIRNYCKVAQTLFDTEEQSLALDYAIAQYLLPRIYGYGNKYENLLINLKNIFEGNQLINSFKILDRIIKEGNEEHSYYKFFK